MSLTFKLLSLVIRTAAKPIGNYIKKQAKDHDGFRRFAVGSAQRVHRIDMRMRLGILHDPAAQERMHERELRAADEKKRQAEIPTVRSEVAQKKHDEEVAKAEKSGSEKKEEKPRKVQIRPLSEARAIELGANFFSEAFIFGVAAGLLIWDSWRSRRKESQRRDDVAERLRELESEVETMRSKLSIESGTTNVTDAGAGESQQKKSWLGYIGLSQSSTGPNKGEAAKDEVRHPTSPQVQTTSPNGTVASQVDGAAVARSGRETRPKAETEESLKDNSQQVAATSAFPKHVE